jgi:hypothetical protein
MALKSKMTAFMYMLAAILMTGNAYAAVTLQPDFKGTIVITTAKGEVQILNPGDAVPEIPSGSSLEVLEGTISISTSAGDSVNLNCLGHTIVLKDDSSADLKVSSDEGLLKVQKGKAGVNKPDGNEDKVAEGDEYHIKKVSQETSQAAPTQAGETLGTGAEGTSDVNPPDSRSIESSPSS